MEPPRRSGSLRKNGLAQDQAVSSSTLHQKLAETTFLLEIVVQVNSLMGKQKSFEEFCIEVGSILQKKIGFKFLHIWICDERDPALLRLVTPETVNGYRTASIFEGIVGRTIREEKTMCVPDVATDPDYVNMHKETKSELCVPLRCDDQIIGVINIETDTPQTFDVERTLIEIIAQHLGRSMKMALLYKTEAQFHHLIEQMSEGVWVGDPEERTLYTNPALQKMLGYDAEELLTKTSYNFFDEESQQKLREENNKRKQGAGGHYEAFLSSKSGEKIPALVHGVPFGHGGTMATITDLRPLKSTEEKLFRTERFLASITQHCSEAIVGIDKHDVVQSWNVGAERMFGYKANEMIEQTTERLIPVERKTAGESNQLIHEALTKGFIRNFETIRLHKNGKPIMVALTISAVRDEKEKVTGLSVLYRDITAQKKWEQELQDRFEKMQEAYREMGRQRRQLDYLMDMINITQTSALTQKQVASFVVNAVMMITKVDATTLRLFDEPKEKLVLTAQSGFTEDWMSKKIIPYRGSIVESAFGQHQPLKILDILSDPRYIGPAIARKNNLRSALIVPLEAKGELLGSLTLYLSNESNLSLLDDEFITVFCKQIAIALRLAQ